MKPVYYRLVFLLFILISLLTYFPALKNGFVYDDGQQVLENYWIRNIKNIPLIITSSTWDFQEFKSNAYQKVYYRPGMHLVFLLEYLLFHFQASGYHTINILLHALNGFLFFLLIYRLLMIYGSKIGPLKNEEAFSVSLLSALFFVVEPVNSEVVNWISAIPELFFTLFSLLCIYFYLSADRKKSLTALSYISFSGALMFKETALVVPILMFSLSLFLTEQHWNEFLISWLKKNYPYFVIAGVFLYIRSIVLGTSSFAGGAQLTIPKLILALPEFTFLLFRNLYQVIVPFSHSMFHPYYYSSSASIPS